MRQISELPEYRIVVPGRAVSFRSPKSKAYKALVRRAAKHIFKTPIQDDVIEVRVDYFHQSRRRMDMDNISKCVLDALNGIAYGDDRQVRLQTSTAYSLASVVHIPNATVDIIKPLALYEEYLFIRIREAQDIF